MTRNEAIIAICDGKIVVDASGDHWRLHAGMFQCCTLPASEWSDMYRALEEDEGPFTLYEEK